MVKLVPFRISLITSIALLGCIQKTGDVEKLIKYVESKKSHPGVYLIDNTAFGKYEYLCIFGPYETNRYSGHFDKYGLFKKLGVAEYSDSDNYHSVVLFREDGYGVHIESGVFPLRRSGVNISYKIETCNEGKACSINCSEIGDVRIYVDTKENGKNIDTATISIGER